MTEILPRADDPPSFLKLRYPQKSASLQSHAKARYEKCKCNIVTVATRPLSTPRIWLNKNTLLCAYRSVYLNGTVALDFHHQRYFHAVAHEGNLTRAAERLNVSQSAVSSQLRHLEERLGLPLFERRGRSLVLTEAGRIAMDQADSIFATGENLLNTFGDRASARRQTLRVGSLATLS
ncbi:LysR family transcriptional regulator [Qipengyuania sp. YIM B01966]|uniref:LysR family transcriptional regulator n=1 Tax=Qipengyuania sp. YIM B01966 TaxID=2778646 RepID=UPI0018F59D36|nr:LysR family transcriptional regulator [Qipengyuania sp. YIM B01966]